MEFNKREITEFMNDFKKAMKELEDKYKVKVEMSGTTYTEMEMTSKFKVTRCDVERNVDGKKDIFNRECFIYGFKPEHYKKDFKLEGKTFYLEGFNRKSPKNCCSIYCEQENKSYKCSSNLVKNALRIN